jgi:hypothetical protein
MAEYAIELCDARPSYVEENVDEFVGTVGRYCPWHARLVELRDYTSRAAGRLPLRNSRENPVTCLIRITRGFLDSFPGVWEIRSLLGYRGGGEEREAEGPVDHGVAREPFVHASCLNEEAI